MRPELRQREYQSLQSRSADNSNGKLARSPVSLVRLDQPAIARDDPGDLGVPACRVCVPSGSLPSGRLP